MNCKTYKSTSNLNIQATLEHPNYWWNTLSNLQKAIRRGDLHQAQISAILLHNTDALKLRRRLCVIALEDIGFGDIKLVSRVLEYAAANKSKLEPSVGASDISESLALVAELVHSVKDRSPCTLSVTAKRNAKAVGRVARLSPEKCAALYADESECILARCVAARSLTGNFTIENQRVGKTSRKGLLSALATMDLPDRIRNLTANGAGFGGEVAGLAANIPILFRLMKAESRRTRVHPLPHAELIRGLLSAAYDVHTLEGKWALSSFAIKCNALRRFSVTAGVDAKKIIGNIVFMAEGSVVDRDVRCALTDELYASNEKSQCAGVSLPYSALPEAKQILVDNLPMLNLCRRRIAEAKSYFDTRSADHRQGVLL